jgi:hypothetical protein
VECDRDSDSNRAGGTGGHGSHWQRATLSPKQRR